MMFNCQLSKVLIEAAGDYNDKNGKKNVLKNLKLGSHLLYKFSYLRIFCFLISHH